MQIILYQTSDNNNRVNKKLNTVSTLDGTLREQSSVINPTVTIEYTNLSGVNYAYIKEFGRYYFVTNITSIRNNLWRLEMRVDVLMTYKSQFLEINAIVERQENAFNLYLNDNQFATQQNTSVVTKLFKNGFSNSGTYLLTVAGAATSTTTDGGEV